jgi:hypothetical protein
VVDESEDRFEEPPAAEADWWGLGWWAVVAVGLVVMCIGMNGFDAAWEALPASVQTVGLSADPWVYTAIDTGTLIVVTGLAIAIGASFRRLGRVTTGWTFVRAVALGLAFCTLGAVAFAVGNPEDCLNTEKNMCVEHTHGSAALKLPAAVLTAAAAGTLISGLGLLVAAPVARQRRRRARW